MNDLQTFFYLNHSLSFKKHAVWDYFVQNDSNWKSSHRFDLSLRSAGIQAAEFVKATTRFNRFVVPLSGGLDSRFILDSLLSSGSAPKDVLCVTFGYPGSAEVEIARQVAGYYGCEWMYLDGNDLIFSLNDLSETVNSFHSLIPINEWLFNSAIGRLFNDDGVITGFMANTIFGNHFFDTPSVGEFTDVEKSVGKYLHKYSGGRINDIGRFANCINSLSGSAEKHFPYFNAYERTVTLLRQNSYIAPVVNSTVNSLPFFLTPSMIRYANQPHIYLNRYSQIAYRKDLFEVFKDFPGTNRGILTKSGRLRFDLRTLFLNRKQYLNNSLSRMVPAYNKRFSNYQMFAQLKSVSYNNFYNKLCQSTDKEYREFLIDNLCDEAITRDKEVSLRLYMLRDFTC